jgi:hypothetical protein
MSDNITTSPSTPTLFNRESIKQSLIKKSGLEAEQAEQITKAITAKLPKGKKCYTEEDIFKAASSIYSFDIGEDKGGNRAIRDGIDALDGVVNVDYKYEDGQGTSTSKATWQAISSNPDGDSRNIVSRSIGRLEKGQQGITVDNIIADLDKSVFKGGQNLGLNTILKTMQEQGITSEQLKEAVKDDAKWLELIGNVKGAEAQTNP